MIRISAVLGCLAALSLAAPAVAQQKVSMTLQAREASSQGLGGPSALMSLYATPDSASGVTRVVSVAKGKPYTLDMRPTGANLCQVWNPDPRVQNWSNIALENGAYHSRQIDKTHSWYGKDINMRCGVAHENELTHAIEFSQVAVAKLTFVAK
ncbi:hypothetical protein KW800_02620 [Candidatus Parcubacteria bacterium]|nr:hypothetical protein [Candidatus Parcubacteria bacterium]